MYREIIDANDAKAEQLITGYTAVARHLDMSIYRESHPVISRT